MIENYDGLTIGQFMQINAALEREDKVDQQLGILAVLTGISEQDLLDMPLAEYTDLAGKAEFLKEPCEPMDVDMKHPEWNGLVPTMDFREITTAQYVDFQTFARDFPKTAIELLSCLLIPKGRRYNQKYDIADVQASIRQMPMRLALGYAAFFFARFSESITDSLTYLAEAMRKSKDPAKKAALRRKIAEVKKDLQGVGDGFTM